VIIVFQKILNRWPKQILNINLTSEHSKITIETLKLLIKLCHLPKYLFIKKCCFVKLFPEITNSAKIHDIHAICAGVKIPLSQCDKEKLTNIFLKKLINKN